jgi:hypothetical protein
MVKNPASYFFLLFLTAPAFAQVTLVEPHYYLNTRERFDAYIFRTYTDLQGGLAGPD